MYLTESESETETKPSLNQKLSQTEPKTSLNQN